MNASLTKIRIDSLRPCCIFLSLPLIIIVYIYMGIHYICNLERSLYIVIMIATDLWYFSLSHNIRMCCMSAFTSCTLHNKLECELCVIQVNVTFNVISVISWWCLLVADMGLPHQKAMSQARWCSIASQSVTFYSWEQVNRTYFLGSPFNCWVLNKEAPSTIFTVFSMIWPGIELTTSRKSDEHSTTGPPGAVNKLVLIFCLNHINVPV